MRISQCSLQMLVLYIVIPSLLTTCKFCRESLRHLFESPLFDITQNTPGIFVIQRQRLHFVLAIRNSNDGSHNMTVFFRDNVKKKIKKVCSYE